MAIRIEGGRFDGMGVGWIARAGGALAGLWLLIAGPGLAQDRPKAVPQTGHSGGTELAVWSHDSRYLVTIGTTFGSGTRKYDAILWDVSAGTVIDRIDVPPTPIPQHYHPQRNEECSPGDDWFVEHLTIDAADRVTVWGHYGYACGYMASRSFMLADRRWQPAVRVDGLPPDGESAVAPNGKWLIAFNGEFYKIVVPAQGGKLFRPFANDASYDHFLWWPDGTRFALLDDFILRVYDLASGRLERRITLLRHVARHRSGVRNRVVIRIDMTPQTVSFWVTRGVLKGKAVPIRVAVGDLAVLPTGPPKYVVAGDLNDREWPQSRSADRRYIHVQGGIARTASLAPPLQLSNRLARIISADVTSDASRVALLRPGAPEGRLWLDVIDVDGLVMHRIASVDPEMDSVRWYRDERLVVSKRFTRIADVGITSVLLIDPAPGGRRWHFERRCSPAYFRDGMLTNGRCEGSSGLIGDWWFARFGEDGWRPVRFKLLDGLYIKAIAGAAQASRAVIITCAPSPRSCGDERAWIVDTAGMRIVGSLPIVELGLSAFHLKSDGSRLLARGDDGRAVAFALPASLEGAIPAVRVPLESTDPLGPNQEGGPLDTVGAEWDRPDTNALRFSRASDHKEIAQLVSLADGGVTVFTPFGSYDTNRRPDNAGIDWLFPDTPMRSLPLETFMRDYFEPNLLRRRLDCTLPANCTKVFHPAPDLTRLNRTVPHVAIAAVEPGDKPGSAEVTVIARPTIDPTAPNRKTGSGLYNLRLYRDDRLVAQVGRVDPQLDATDLAAWRQSTMLAPPGTTAPQRFSFTVALPPSVDKRDVIFRAYAFNEDRVKAETAVGGIETVAAPPRRPRLYLLTIGIDFYAGAGFPSLRYAGADARMMADLLKRLRSPEAGSPPLEVHAESVIGTSDQPATRERIRAAFAHLKDARPGDIVVITYAGHGFTDARGRFSLVPSDARRIGDRPDPASLIRAGDLSEWLEPVDAGEIAFVIDACHSAASVSADGFKPGPLGDPGLGQLAYDKGIRILAASQPDQVALELSSVGHGALTYALAQRGVAERKADLDHDGFIRLDELLRYAAGAVQAADAPAEGDETSLIVDWGRDARYVRQKPALFDYVGSPAAIGIRPAS